jgi:methylmalonyl-CoA mutase N-terminal domain/subunit
VDFVIKGRECNGNANELAFTTWIQAARPTLDNRQYQVNCVRREFFAMGASPDT